MQGSAGAEAEAQWPRHPAAGFNSIQAAVDDANGGDTVEVCDGTYEEQVLIESPDKDDLILRSKEQFGARITYPAEPESPEVLVDIDNADDVTVRGFEITGPYPETDCAGDHIGVRVIGAQARVALNRISAIQGRRLGPVRLPGRIRRDRGEQRHGSRRPQRHRRLPEGRRGRRRKR